MATLRSEQLDAQLAKQLAPVYLIHGDEPLLSIEAADSIRVAARRAGFTQRSVLIAERGFKWGELHAAGASMSLFGDKNLVELRIPTGKPGTGRRGHRQLLRPAFARHAVDGQPAEAGQA